MVQTKLFLLDKQKKFHTNHSKFFIKYGSGKHWTPEKELIENHERFLKYVDLNFKRKSVPITDDEIRKHIKKSFKDDAGLSFMAGYLNDYAYDNLINDVTDSKEYNDAVESKQTSIKIKNKTRKQERKGVKVSKNYYYVVIKARKNKSGKHISAQRRFYSINTGKQVKTKNVEKYLTEVIPNKKEEVALTKSRFRQQTPLRRIRRKEERKERLKKLRGRSRR